MRKEKEILKYMNKEWYDIPMFENMYQITKNGDIRSLDRTIIYHMKNGNVKTSKVKGKLLKFHHNNKGYCMICLYKNGKSHHKLVHRLVAETFIPNPNNLPEVDHKDENKDNNCVYNLRWCTRQFNNTRGIQSRFGREKTSKFRMRSVGKFDKNGNLICIYDGVRIASRNENISDRNICRCCKDNKNKIGRLKDNHTLKGFVWRYM